MGRALEMMRALSGGMVAPPGGGDQEAEKRSRIQFIRGLTASYMDLYNQAGTLAEKDNYQRLLKGLTGGLPPEDQKILAPMLKGTPLDPLELKRSVFQQEYGKRPGLPEDYQANPMLYFQALKNQNEYDARQSHFMTGQAKPLNRILSGPEGNFGVVKADGSIALLDSKELNAEGRAAAFGMPLEEFMANDGIKYGESRRMMVSGQSVDVTPRYDTINKKRLPDLQAPTESELSRLASGNEGGKQLTARQLNIMKEFLLGDPAKSELYKVFKTNVIDKGEMSPQGFATKYLEREFPGSVVLLTDIERSRGWVDFLSGRDKNSPVQNGWFGNAWVRGEGFDLRVIPGQWVSFDNDPAMYILDDQQGILRDSSGVMIPDPQKFLQGKGKISVY